MKKCPLLKITDYIDYEGIICKPEESTATREEFQDCIGEECMAWSEHKKYCMYLMVLHKF